MGNQGEGLDNVSSKTYVLPADVELVPVSELPASIRINLAYSKSDWAVSRRFSRGRTKLVDAEFARLIEEFKTPVDIVEAIFRFSKANGQSAERVFEAAAPLLLKLVDAGLLVDATTDRVHGQTFRFQPGARLGDLVIDRQIQLFDESEVYQASIGGDTPVALKLSRGKSERARRRIERERITLESLESAYTPRLLKYGTTESEFYIAVEWVEGSSLGVWTKQASSLPMWEGTRQRISVCRNVLYAYAELHELGVIHGDVHPGNILVSPSGGIRIIDFGFSSSEKNVATERGGVLEYYDPQLAKAIVKGHRAPVADFLSEQYSIAALLYYILAGNHYAFFSTDKNSLLAQVIRAEPMPLIVRGIANCASIERILQHALEKQPSRRHPSTAAFRDAFDNATQPSAVALACTRRDLSSELIAAADLDGPLIESVFSGAPACSVNFGGAGVAYALHRLAILRREARILSIADVWADLSVSNSTTRRAFDSHSLALSRRQHGNISLYHALPGVHCVRALVASSMGDTYTMQVAFDAYLRSVAHRGEILELALGNGGLLLGATLMVEAGLALPMLDDSALRAFGANLFAEILSSKTFSTPVCAGRLNGFLGIAHGWAGLVYALIRWARCAKIDFPEVIETKLDEIRDFGFVKGSGLYWPKTFAEADVFPSWCHGTAGYVFLWGEAYLATSDCRYINLAEMAGRSTWEDGDTAGDLCCGYAGRSYALLFLYRLTNDEIWRRRATDLATRSIGSMRDQTVMRSSLYKGMTGVAVLEAELSDPHLARLPLFE